MEHILGFFHSKHDDYLLDMLTFRCFRLDWWSPLLQNVIQSLLCCFINMKELMLQSQIACQTFTCLSQSSPLRNWLMGNRDMPKELGLFYVVFLTVPLYTQWEILSLSRSPFQHHLIRCPQILCWFSKGYI